MQQIKPPFSVISYIKYKSQETSPDIVNSLTSPDLTLARL